MLAASVAPHTNTQCRNLLDLLPCMRLTLPHHTNSRLHDPHIFPSLCLTLRIRAFSPQIGDLREGDLLSDLEARNCTFMHLHKEGGGWDAWPAARHLVSPIVLPAFFYAGQVQRVVDSGSVCGAQEVVLEQVRVKKEGGGRARGAQYCKESTSSAEKAR